MFSFYFLKIFMKRKLYYKVFYFPFYSSEVRDFTFFVLFLLVFINLTFSSDFCPFNIFALLLLISNSYRNTSYVIIISYKFSDCHILFIAIIISYVAQLTLFHSNDAWFSARLKIFNYIILLSLILFFFWDIKNRFILYFLISLKFRI